MFSPLDRREVDLLNDLRSEPRNMGDRGTFGEEVKVLSRGFTRELSNSRKSTSWEAQGSDAACAMF